MKPPLPLEVYSQRDRVETFFPNARGRISRTRITRDTVTCPRSTAALALAIAFAAGFNAAVWLACLIATHS